MKRLYILFAFASILLAGCTEIHMENGIEALQEALQPMIFSASVSEEQDTKATIDGLDIKWSAGDKIGIFDGTAFREFTLKEGAGTTSAVFEGEAAEAASYIAVYPYSKDLSVESDGIHGLSVPKIQIAGECPVIMTAKCEDGGNAFAFKNALAYVKFTPQFDCHKVVFETYGKGNERYSRDLSGDIVLARDYDYNNYWRQPEVEIMSARVTANACNHIILGGDIKTGVPCYIAVAPRIMEAGFKFIFDASDDNLQYSRSSFKRPYSGFMRGHVLNFGAFSKKSTAWTESAVELASYDADVYGNSDTYTFDYRSIYDWKDVTRIVKQCNKIGSTKKVRIYFMEDVDFGGREIKPEKIDITGGVIRFYGYGHKISNYVQGTADYDDARHAGLFFVKKISTFIVEGLSLYPNSFNVTSGGDIYGGAFVSKAHCDALLNFEDCRVNGNISVKCTGNDQAYAGGFVGMAECHGEESEYLSPSSMNSLEMQDCLMDGSVTAYSEDDIAYAGGFFGFIDSPEESYSYKIWRCRNRADILAKGDDDSTPGLGFGLDGISAGGIIGRDHDGDGNVAADLNSCVNEGSVTAHAMDNDNSFAGGMIGCHDSDGTSESMALFKPVKPSVNNCLNKGAITVKGGTGYFGNMSGLAAGMVGYCYNDDTVFRNCVDAGTSLSSDDVCAHISGSKGSYENACYWTKDDSLPGIHDKYDHGQYGPGRMSGYKADLSAGTLNELKFDASWTTRDGHLDLDIIR